MAGNKSTACLVSQKQDGVHVTPR